jgi:hypothetical protein
MTAASRPSTPTRAFWCRTWRKHGWALFMDGDMLVRDNLVRMFQGLDPSKAVYCVKHRYEAKPGAKMDGQVQTAYARKNWSSFIVFNCDHPANRALTLEMVNSVPGRDLHRLCWIEDDSLIGELGPEWNYLVGETWGVDDPKVVHFTSGVPDMPGYENVPIRRRVARAAQRLGPRRAEFWGLMMHVAG